MIYLTKVSMATEAIQPLSPEATEVVPQYYSPIFILNNIKIGEIVKTFTVASTESQNDSTNQATMLLDSFKRKFHFYRINDRAVIINKILE